MYLLCVKRSTAQTAVEKPIDLLTKNALTAEVMVASKDTAHLILKTDWAICLDRWSVAAERGMEAGRSSSGLCQHPISILSHTLRLCRRPSRRPLRIRLPRPILWGEIRTAVACVARSAALATESGLPCWDRLSCGYRCGRRRRSRRKSSKTCCDGTKHLAEPGDLLDQSSIILSVHLNRVCKLIRGADYWASRPFNFFF